MRPHSVRLPLTIAAMTFLAALAYTQTPAAKSDAPPANFSLTGDRFKPLTWDAMTPAQKTMVQHILAGDRKNLGGPFNVLLRSPEMGDLAQAFGAQARFHSSLPPRLNELAIIVTARFWTVQFEWNAHRRAAAQAGLSEDTIQAIATGKRPAKMAADETAVYNFATELAEEPRRQRRDIRGREDHSWGAAGGRYVRRDGLLPDSRHAAERRPVSDAGRVAAGAEAAGAADPLGAILAVDREHVQVESPQQFLALGVRAGRVGSRGDAGLR